MLYIVSTPIGNLKDITLRALDVLKSVQLIAAEDTRHSRKLLNHYSIETVLTSFHDHNKESKSALLIEKMKSGDDVALISDAGTPGISDPGFYLVRLARREGINVVSIPGASAVLTALTSSGQPTDRFVFEGFLPAKSMARRKKLAEFLNEDRTIIVYESIHRLVKSLQDIAEVLNDPIVTVARELTKSHEEVLTRPASELVEYYTTKTPKGECVLLWNLKSK